MVDVTTGPANPWPLYLPALAGEHYSLITQGRLSAANPWVRKSGAFDSMIGFEGALGDPSHPTRMLPVYDCGDHLHPSDAGYLQIGDSIDPSIFDRH